jgi:hypothetical protein
MDDFPYQKYSKIYDFAHAADVKGFLCFSIPNANKGRLFFKSKDGRLITFYEGYNMAREFAEYNGKLIQPFYFAVFKNKSGGIVEVGNEPDFLYGEEYEVPLRNPNDEQNSKTPKDG